MDEPKAYMPLSGLSITEHAQRAREQNSTMRAFDWDKARAFIEEHGLKSASCGLREDWFWTCAPLIEDGVMVSEDDCEAYLESIWATPVIYWNTQVSKDNEDYEAIEHYFDCWKFVEEPI